MHSLATTFYYATLHNFYSYTVKLVFICLSINVAFCIVKRKKLNEPFLRLFYFLILNLIIEVLAYAFIQFKINNLPLLHLYTLGEFLLLSYFFASLIRMSLVVKKIFMYFVIVGSLFIVINSILFQSIYGFNTFAKTFVQVAIISYAMLYFYNITIHQSDLFESMSKSLRLVNSAILMYYSGSLFIFMCGKFSLIEVKGYEVFWAFNAVLNLIFHLLIFIGLWKAFYKRSTLSL